MIPFYLNDIAPIIGAELKGPNITIYSVSTDSRSLIGKKCLFVALKGNKYDAHNFVSHALCSGAIALLVNCWMSFDVPQLIVKDTRHALRLLSSWVRQQVPIRIAAITGSSGKTTVKEMTAIILKQIGRVILTKENQNNDIGVSLTLLNITKKHHFAVLEVGANHIGEINLSVNLIKPDASLINNLHEAHLEGFGSLQGISQAKGEIIQGTSNNGYIIINNNNDYTNCQHAVKKNTWKFAMHPMPGVDFYATEINYDSQYRATFNLNCPIGKCLIHLSVLGPHNIENALAASALAIAMGAPLSAISAGLAKMKSIPRRLFPIWLDANKLLLDDSYNANVGSMKAAILTPQQW